MNFLAKKGLDMVKNMFGDVLSGYIDELFTGWQNYNRRTGQSLEILLKLDGKNLVILITNHDSATRQNTIFERLSFDIEEVKKLEATEKIKNEFERVFNNLKNL